jgi:hypothetical protein
VKTESVGPWDGWTAGTTPAGRLGRQAAHSSLQLQFGNYGLANTVSVTLKQEHIGVRLKDTLLFLFEFEIRIWNNK